jgi:hypothetical protein
MPTTTPDDRRVVPAALSTPADLDDRLALETEQIQEPLEQIQEPLDWGSIDDEDGAYGQLSEAGNTQDPDPEMSVPMRTGEGIDLEESALRHAAGGVDINSLTQAMAEKRGAGSAEAAAAAFIANHLEDGAPESTFGLVGSEVLPAPRSAPDLLDVVDEARPPCGGGQSIHSPGAMAENRGTLVDPAAPSDDSTKPHYLPPAASGSTK